MTKGRLIASHIASKKEETALIATHCHLGTATGSLWHSIVLADQSVPPIVRTWTVIPCPTSPHSPRLGRRCHFRMHLLTPQTENAKAEVDDGAADDGHACPLAKDAAHVHEQEKESKPTEGEADTYAHKHVSVHLCVP